MLIGNRQIKNLIISQLIQDIKQKKELLPLADRFVKTSLRKHLSQTPSAVTFLQSEFTFKSARYKQIIKQVRRELRQVHSLFQVLDVTQRKPYFQQLLQTKPSSTKFLEIHHRILETHSSTKERVSFYPSLYQKIFNLTTKPQILLDLGCGLNPFSFPFMKLSKLTYYAYDINQEETSLLNKYFQFLKKLKPSFQGQAKILDLSKITKLPSADLAFLWKVTDVLERKKSHKISEQVIVSLPVKYVVVSFPTITVRGVSMNQPRRKWIELMSSRLGYSFKVLKFQNEIFYLIKK